MVPIAASLSDSCRPDVFPVYTQGNRILCLVYVNILETNIRRVQYTWVFTKTRGYIKEGISSEIKAKMMNTIWFRLLEQESLNYVSSSIYVDICIYNIYLSIYIYVYLYIYI